ncbi:hypothetical protein CDCA_CDCA16G4145 [Cyanidium caldarium]|uniref:CID domain-containing protein n=1 Tax=Cyanidium caldarium TaxID=2771 RepID=A0AAV9J1C6_CYACA|nr:hypothetical protein CDCA_CDCA16G4145 [Cyanidium caldarium]
MTASGEKEESNDITAETDGPSEVPLAAEAFRGMLRHLEGSSLPMITALSWIATENVEAVDAIAVVLVERLSSPRNQAGSVAGDGNVSRSSSSTASDDSVLATLHLVDAIVKRVGPSAAAARRYAEALVRVGLPEAVAGVYAQRPLLQGRLDKLLQTWEQAGLFGSSFCRRVRTLIETNTSHPPDTHRSGSETPPMPPASYHAAIQEATERIVAHAQQGVLPPPEDVAHFDRLIELQLAQTPAHDTVSQQHWSQLRAHMQSLVSSVVASARAPPAWPPPAAAYPPAYPYPSYGTCMPYAPAAPPPPPYPMPGAITSAPSSAAAAESSEASSSVSDASRALRTGHCTSFRDLKRTSTRAAVAALYNELPVRADGTGVRFRTRRQLREHLDWVFADNQRRRLRERGAVSRSWYLQQDEWLARAGHRPGTGFERPTGDARAGGAGDDDVDGDAFVRLGANFAPPDAGSATADVDAAAARSAPDGGSGTDVPAGDEDAVCPVCREEFESYFDHRQNVWMWRDALLDPETHMHFHRKCYGTGVNLDTVHAPASLTQSSATGRASPPKRRKVKEEEEEEEEEEKDGESESAIGNVTPAAEAETDSSVAKPDRAELERQLARHTVAQLRARLDELHYDHSRLKRKAELIAALASQRMSEWDRPPASASERPLNA